MRAKAACNALGHRVVEVVNADGSGWRALARIARKCSGGLGTTLDWSPSGRIAVSGKRPSGSGFVVWFPPPARTREKGRIDGTASVSVPKAMRTPMAGAHGRNRMRG